MILFQWLNHLSKSYDSCCSQYARLPHSSTNGFPEFPCLINHLFSPNDNWTNGTAQTFAQAKADWISTLAKFFNIAFTRSHRIENSRPIDMNSNVVFLCQSLHSFELLQGPHFSVGERVLKANQSSFWVEYALVFSNEWFNFVTSLCTFFWSEDSCLWSHMPRLNSRQDC